ncbi:MAG TPA: chromosome segregation protein SMC [Deltaproteobacteria bacterium]|nr:MAG: chromosome segregation protein SMC [Deltaproteobacteria bacterium GWA2_45_12]HBF13722.1 chromosome segregation protein SMC [Deltaproteobacteria bacterium]
MKIKRIEIIGFKSFMDKTVVTFDKDVTAVVGPNGCGKSNIVDAIRWVMGEQSAKHLRGKNMEDVIFAGTESRAPLSMASVELTFSTEGYQTPAAYLNHSEISICRRLYRTGDSEYLINKVPVRLKDITDLFLGTGIGTKAYSIIEQGRVGQIITSKPEERRYYIEEVAGVSKFKARKESALRKMEATSQNLLRLTDVIGELERQVRSLDRQARKAEKYRELRTEFEKWDLALSAADYADAFSKQEEGEASLKKLGEEEIGLKSVLQNEENEIEAVRFGLLEKEKELNEVQNRLFEVTNYIRLSESGLKFKKDERVHLQARTEEGVKFLTELEMQYEGVSQGLIQIDDQKWQADMEAQSCQEELVTLASQNENIQTGLTDVAKQLEAVREELYATEARLHKLDAEKQNLHRKKDDLKKVLSHDEEKLGGLKSQYHQAQKVYHEVTSTLTGLKQLKFDLTTKTDSLFQELGQLKSNLDVEQKNLFRLKEELTLKQSRLSSLEELSRNFEGYQEGTRSVLLKKKELAEEGIFGTVADFVETEPMFENAVSAVLGEKLQYVVVKSQQEGLQAVEYLNTLAGGRSSFVPLGVRSSYEQSGEISSQEGVLGPLRQFVNLPSDYQTLSEFLFGDVVVVDTLKRALDLWSFNGHRKTLVTLGGEVVDPSGVITGGSTENTSKALLEKKREMKDLGVLIENLKGELQAKEGQCQNLIAQVGVLEGSLEVVKSTSFEEEIKIANQEKDLTHFKKELSKIETDQAELVSRLEQAHRQLDELATTEQIFEEEQKTLAEKSLNLTAELAVKKSEYEGLAKSAATQAEILTQIKIKVAQSRERMDHLDAEIKRLIDEKGRLFLEKIKKTEEQLGFMFKDEQMAAQCAHIEKMLVKRMDQKTTIESSMRTLRESYETQTGLVREREQGFKKMRDHLALLAQQISQVTISLTEVRGLMKHLTEQCLERHRLSLADIYKDRLDSNLDREQAKVKVSELREKLSNMGDVNPQALQEYDELKTRLDFLLHQKTDLETSLKTLERVIQKINRTTRERFLATFKLVDETFQKVFPKLFQGGRARLALTNEENLLETGVDIIAQPPGKKLQSISLLSGGEKALTAVSFIFSIFLIKPSPFCILDEVDAPLDEANVHRYNDMIRTMTDKSQFIVITHNKRTMEMVDVLYGVTMQEAGVSQLVSVNLH